MTQTGDIVTIVLIVLLVVAINLVWAVGLASDYRASRFGWLLFGTLIPFVGIVRGFLAIKRAR